MSKSSKHPTEQVLVRPERPADLAAIRSVNHAAFPEPAEADAVDALRANGKATVSLVAVQADRVVGHILFSPVTIGSGGHPYPALGLGPMAVLPDVQRAGIGSRLVTEGLVHCSQAGVGCVVVLGHPTYYPRFGFVPASRFGIGCEYRVPDEVFMAIELAPGALTEVSGICRYAPEIADV